MTPNCPQRRSHAPTSEVPFSINSRIRSYCNNAVDELELSMDDFSSSDRLKKALNELIQVSVCTALTSHCEFS